MTEHGSDTDERTDETAQKDAATAASEDRDATEADASPDGANARDSDLDGSAAESDEATADRESATDGGGRSKTRKVLYWTVLGGLVLFGGLMVLLVYSDVRSLINVFVGRRYRLLIQTAFHLVLVLCAAIGVSLIVRRLERLPG